jgi:hypothetical protein
MTGEFTSWCTHYYRLTKLFLQHNERINKLLADAPPYTSQRNLSDLDAIISYNRKVQAVKAKADKTFKHLTETGRTILKVMQYFEIPPHVVLTGEIPGELEFEIWANENDALFINKIKDLQPGAHNPNIIVIDCWADDEDD